MKEKKINTIESKTCTTIDNKVFITENKIIYGRKQDIYSQKQDTAKTTRHPPWKSRPSPKRRVTNKTLEVTRSGENFLS